MMDNKSIGNNDPLSAVDPGKICRVPSGFVYLSGMQFLSGYCILQANPEVPSINDLPPTKQAVFFADMTLVGDAILEITGAYRINYALMGNSSPILHAHIVPRYLSEPEHLRNGLPWSYPNFDHPATSFDPKRDMGLLQRLRGNILKRLEERTRKE